MSNSGSIGDFFQSFIQTVGVTPSALSTQSGFSAANVLDWQNPLYRYQSNATSPDQTLLLDLGASPPSYVGIYLEGLNFAACTWQANATDVWTSPSFAQSITVSVDPVTSLRRGIFFFNAAHTTQSYRYTRLLIAAGTARDDGANFKVAKFFPLVSAREVINRGEIIQTRQRPVLTNEFPAGRKEILRQGEQFVTLELPWQWMWNVALDAATDEKSTMLALATDPDTPVVICRDLNRPTEAYIMRNEANFGLSSEGVGARMPLVYRQVS